MTERHLRSTPTDGYATPTSHIQAATEQILRSHLPSASEANQGPVLQKNIHLQYLLRNLVQGFPERYTSQDASQPWLIFWTLQGFSVLGVGLDDQTKKRAIETLLALQHPEGGFGGGPGQAAHLLPTYAAVCALAIVGRPGEGGGWEVIDRQKMYKFFMSLKQQDGSFLVMHHGEVDMRGIYCLITVATMLNMLTPELLAGVPEFIASCQTYEGGFGNASFPGWVFEEDDPERDGSSTDSFNPSSPRPPLGEAHGGYTFCATATWVLLQPYLRLYYPSSAPAINRSALLRWLTQMQGIPAEIGGFRGRTNKLVDGCYSWWVGGCVVLAETLLGIGLGGDRRPEERGKGEEHAGEDGWDDVDDSLFDRRALQEYILYAGQHPAGGLRDKPPKPSDSYHTLYCLSGLSAAQHRVIPHDARRAEVLASWRGDIAKEKKCAGLAAPSGDGEILENLRREIFLDTLSWSEEEGTVKYVGGSGNRVNATHPLFNLTVTHSEAIMAYFYGQTLPVRKPHHAASTPPTGK
ncbi:Protein farnesyltransferase subunit beta [Grifola frondosa]|uniref:Protein farnesyltransferase subunit beta n=1 Tax=Grifola frondosa TaxID=5627 RepID=A0A1C7M765_GRIFR|nr:Protein farnesyltransferase subunit beta [Grifola frondosa]